MASAPSPPDPAETAAAQSSSNRSAAIASGLLNNHNEVTPFGTSTYTDTGNYVGKDEMGERYSIPLRTRTVTLSPTEQAKYDQKTSAEMGLLGLANNQIGRLNNTLGEPFNFDGAPGRVSSINAPPRLTTARTGRDLQSRYGGNGPINYGANLAAPDYQDSVGETPGYQASLGATPGYQVNYAPQGGFSADRARVSEGIMSRINPQLEQQRQSLEGRLVAQGLQRGTPAFQRAMQEQGQNVNDAYIQADLAGGQEQSRLLGEARSAGQFRNQALGQGFQDRVTAGNFTNTALGQGFQDRMAAGNFTNTARGQGFQDRMAAGQFQNQAQQQGYDQASARAGFANTASLAETQRNMAIAEQRNQTAQQTYQNRIGTADFQNQARQAYIQEQAMLRNQPINETGALMSGSQVNVPQFAAPYRQGIDPAPIGDYTYQSYNAEANAAAQKNQGMFGLATSLMGLPFALSDRRIKTDIKRVGTTDGGIPIYTYRLITGGPVQMGVMAQEAPADAVLDVDGVLAVDYGKIS